MTTYYVDASVAADALSAVGESAARHWLEVCRIVGDQLVSSRLLHLELVRVARRDGLNLAKVEAVADRVNLVDITNWTLKRAEQIGPHVKSLDSIHLATAQLIDPDMTLATHDSNMAAVGRALGFEVFDPLAA